MSIGFCVYCAFLSIQFLITKNYVFLVYTIIFDLAAIGVLVDLTDQFFVNRHWYQAKHLAARLKGSLTKHKDVQQMIRAIPIFEGLPEAALKQMVQSSKILQMNSGERICKHGDRTSDLYVVITGKVGIFRKETNGKTEKIIEINEGSIFGEGAFLLDRSRVGSAYCLKKTALLAIKRPKIVATSERLQEQNLSLFQKKIWGFQALAHSELFNEIPSEALMQLINNCEVKSVAEQSLVIRQGDFSDSLWIIVQGQCQVITDKGPIRDMHAKDIFGEIGLLWNSPRTSSVVTTAPCVLLKLSANHFWELMAQNLNLAIALQVLGESRLKLT